MSRTRHREKKANKKFSEAGKYCDRENGKCDHSCPPCVSQRKYKNRKLELKAGATECT